MMPDETPPPALSVEEAWAAYERAETEVKKANAGTFVLAKYARESARVRVEAAIRAESAEAWRAATARAAELEDALEAFLETKPPSMERPYNPGDFDNWRNARKTARAALASTEEGQG